MNKLFPKYIRIYDNSVLAKIEELNNKAIYYKPCGDYQVTVFTDNQKTIYGNIGNEITHEIKEASPREFLVDNPYGYGVISTKLILDALKDCGME